MPDITMCRSETCKCKEVCYRTKAKPTLLYQSYTDFTEDCKKHDYRNCMALGMKNFIER